MIRRSASWAVVISIAAFVVMAMPEAGLGTTWPEMRRDLGRPLADLGTLIAAGVVAYALTTAASGRIVERLGTGRTTVAATTIGLIALIGYSTAGSWLVVLVCALILGAGGGLLDATFNAHAAQHFSPGATNLLHAGFGVGATIGPLVVAGLVDAGAGWQAAFVVFAVAQAILLVVLLTVRRSWRAVEIPADAGDGPRRVDAVALASIAVFFVYTGLEIAAGQWSFTLLVEGRGFRPATAGLWVAAYWAGLTVGRLALGLGAARIGPRRVLTASTVGAVAASLLFWWNPGGIGLAGLPLLGISLAGVFPTLVTLTPSRVGAGRSTRMIGYQLAAAAVGAAAIPWVIGQVLEAAGLSTLAPLLALVSLVMLALHVLLDRLATPRIARGGR